MADSLWTVGMSIRISVHSVCPLRLPPWLRAPLIWSNHSPKASLTAPMPCRLAEGVCCKEFCDVEHRTHMSGRDHQTARAAEPSMSGRSPWVYTIVHHPLTSASRRRTSESPSRSAVSLECPERVIPTAEVMSYVVKSCLSSILGLSKYFILNTRFVSWSTTRIKCRSVTSAPYRGWWVQSSCRIRA